MTQIKSPISEEVPVREFLERVLEERDRLYIIRFDEAKTALSAALIAQKEALNVALIAQKEAVNAAFLASEKAIIKAEDPKQSGISSIIFVLMRQKRR